MDLNPTIASLEPPAGQGERAWRKHLSHPAGIRTVLPRLGPELLRQQLQGIAFRPFQALGLGCQRRSDPFLPPHLEGGEGSAGNLGMLTQMWTRSTEPGQDPVCERLDPWRRGQGVLSRQQLLVGTLPVLERKGKFPRKPSLGFTGSAFGWVSRPSWASPCCVISLPSLSTSNPSRSGRALSPVLCWKLSFVRVTPEPADLVQPVLRVAPETRQPRPR